ncbi:MAG: VWA domain-containing protein [Myxococcales bacterium]|nr:MAG: VWA domain-containing protein [Myxococcales bacterium]
MKHAIPVTACLVALLFCSCGNSSSLDFAPGDGDTEAAPADGDSETDGPPPDGDEPHSTCPEIGGDYLVLKECESVESFEGSIVQEEKECSFVFVLGRERFEGAWEEERIVLNGRVRCVETDTPSAAMVFLCSDDCRLYLYPSEAFDAQGQLKVEPDRICTRGVWPGETATYSLTLRAESSGPLTVIDYFASPSLAPSLSVEPASMTPPLAIQPEQGVDLDLVYSPGFHEVPTGEFCFVGDSSESPLACVQFGPCPEPLIEIEPTTIDFGAAPLGFENEKYFIIKSVGGAAARIVDISLEDDQNGAFVLGSFDTVNFEAKPPFDLESSFAKPVYCKFSPKEGIHEEGKTYTGRGKVVWINKDSEEETIIFYLVGTIAVLLPPCLEVQPLDGWVNFGGIGEAPGPGIKFGYSQIGVVKEREVTIRNCGDQPLTISSMVWQNSFFDNPPFAQRAFSEDPGSFHDYTLRRGETIYIAISFLPPNEGLLYSSGFLFNTNAERYAWQPDDTPPPDPTLPVTVGVSGIGARRGIEVLPAKLDFDVTTTDCCSRPGELTVYNIGDLELTITEIKIGAGSGEHFELLGVPPLPITLGGEGNPQSFSFEVRFCAEAEGSVEGRVEISSNDANSGQFIVPLKGNGTTATHQRDEFQQATHPMADILWVVDCSGSMSEEHDKIKDQTNDFINQAVAWDADLHLALISGDITSAVGHKGLMRGNPPVLANRGPGAMTPDQIISGFNSKVSGLYSDCDGGAREAGLEAAHLALSEPLISNENEGFLRGGTKLAIIFLSDEEDQSEDNVPFFIDFFRSIKGARNVNMLEMYAIVGDAPEGCQSGTGNEAQTANPGQRYIFVADACNPHDTEHFYSICAENYAPVFDRLAENLFALRNQFFLSRLADPDTIVVTVNGQTAEDWEYDEETNSIVFPWDDPPAPGAAIRVDYDTLCLQ